MPYVKLTPGDRLHLNDMIFPPGAHPEDGRLHYKTEYRPSGHNVYVVSTLRWGDGASSVVELMDWLGCGEGFTAWRRDAAAVTQGASIARRQWSPRHSIPLPLPE
jgi:hypothetical protein